MREHSSKGEKEGKKIQIILNSHSFCPLLEWNQVKSFQIPPLSLVILCLGPGETVKLDMHLFIVTGSHCCLFLIKSFNIYIFFLSNASFSQMLSSV